jgi:hypothetical protein
MAISHYDIHQSLHQVVEPIGVNQNNDGQPTSNNSQLDLLHCQTIVN